MSSIQRSTEQPVLDEIVRRIVEVAQPEKIILFGSAARGESGPDSDVDLLVIKSGVHRRRLAQAIYMNLFGVRQAVDVVVGRTNARVSRSCGAILIGDVVRRYAIHLSNCRVCPS